MLSSSVTASAGSTRSAAMFSGRCATDDVPGISTVVADRRNSQANATCCALASSRAARPWSASRTATGETAEREERRERDVARPRTGRRARRRRGWPGCTGSARSPPVACASGQLGGGDAAESEVADQAPFPQLGQRAELVRDGFIAGDPAPAPSGPWDPARAASCRPFRVAVLGRTEDVRVVGESQHPTANRVCLFSPTSSRSTRSAPRCPRTTRSA